jgi:hypothetical protein
MRRAILYLANETTFSWDWMPKSTAQIRGEKYFLDIPSYRTYRWPRRNGAFCSFVMVSQKPSKLACSRPPQHTELDCGPSHSPPSDSYGLCEMPSHPLPSEPSAWPVRDHRTFHDAANLIPAQPQLLGHGFLAGRLQPGNGQSLQQGGKSRARFRPRQRRQRRSA